MAQRVPLLGTTEPLNVLDMARPIKAVEGPQFTHTYHFSVIIEIVESVLQVTMSGGKLGPASRSLSPDQMLTFADK